ncbi:hypothetical protein KR093_006514 [Drosophila rubida]|uniref:CLIP domain-containing serine protease n=1 Tax=Drosophila rubida TaxID=30044 RepID=A0AAD4JW88_9MUSC|nr:hypothetical protein KR093_006514 [Drosophila rubida]
MKLTSCEVITLTITFACLATPSSALLKESKEENTTANAKTDSCILATGELGECVDIRKCPTILKELKVKKTDPKFVRYVKDSNSICGEVGHNVCCPKMDALVEAVPRFLPDEEEFCGSPTVKTFRRIVGGNPAKLGSWPWIALLGYDYGSSYLFKCGGTLVTARHVLTAAHCILDDLIVVRLGEYDLSRDDETQHVDIKVVKKISHPQFHKRSGRGDLGIIHLERNVEFTDLIIPICMPKSDRLMAKSYINFNPFIIGWGKTEEGGQSANILNELQVRVWDNEVCHTSYAKLNRSFTDNQFDSAVICAGDLQGGKDSCQGDSGGPLMAPEIYGRNVKFFLIGVVAYGYGCARPNAPGVYTSTRYFMNWIIDQIQDTA